MAWTAPRTYATGETITAAIFNADLRDNMLETAVAKSTAVGDITYASGLNVLQRTGIGSGGTSLQVRADLAGPQWTHNFAQIGESLLTSSATLWVWTTRPVPA